MSECKPQSLEEAYQSRPAAPAVPNPGPNPAEPENPYIRADALRDPNIPGSIASTEAQVKQLEAELAQLESADAKAAAEAFSKAASGAEQLVRNSDSVLERLDAAIKAKQAELNSATQPGTAEFGRLVRSLNELRAARVSFANLRQGFAGVQVAFQALGADPQTAKVLTGTSLAVGAMLSGSPIAAMTLAATAVGATVLPKEATEWLETKGEKFCNDFQSFAQSLETIDLNRSADYLANAASTYMAGSQLEKGIKAFKDCGTALSSKIDDAAYWVNEAAKYIGFIQAFLLAACKLLEAIKQIFDNLKWIMANLDTLLAQLVLNLIPQQVTFKLPRQPNYLLRAVDGLNSRLAGFSAVGKCINSLLGKKEEDAASTEQPFNFEQAYEGMLQKIEKDVQSSISGGVQGAMQAMGFGLSDEERAMDNPMAVFRNRWKNWTGLNKLAPTPPVVLPEEGALLSYLNTVISGIGFAAGLFDGLFKPGVGDVQPADMAMAAKDVNGNPVPVHPHPANSLQNQIANVKNQLALARAAAARAAGAQTVANAITRYVKKEIPGQQLAATLTNQMGQTALSTNVLRDAELDGLIPAAEDYFACQAKDKQLPDGDDGIPQGLKQPTQEELLNAYADATKAGSVMPFSAAALLKDWHGDLKNDPKLSTELIYTELNERVLRTAMSDSHQAFVRRFFELDGRDELEELPILLLLNSNPEYAEWKHFTQLREEFAQADRAAHQGLYAKAKQQGLLANSAFTFLAAGLQTVATFDLLDALQQFLRHDYRHDLRPFATWTDSIRAVQPSVARPQNLTPEETRAAEESARFYERHKLTLAKVSDFIVRLRLRADELGGPAGYELFAMLAATVILKRIELIYLANRPEEEVKALAKKGQAVLAYVSHPSNLDEAFKVLAEMD